MIAIKKNKVFKYLFMTFIVTYFFWGFDGILSRFGLYIHPSYNIGLIFYIIAVCAPAISAYIALQSDTDTKGIQYFLTLSFSPNRPSLSFLLIIAFCGIRFGIPYLFGDVSITGNWGQVVVFIPVMLLFGGFEEIGWRGFLQFELECKFGFTIATLINAGVWILWHIPLCFIQGTDQYSGNYLWFAISLIGMSFSLAAIRRIGGSILACILFHSLANSIISYGISIKDSYGVIVSTIIQIVFATAIASVYENANNIRK